MSVIPSAIICSDAGINDVTSMFSAMKVTFRRGQEVGQWVLKLSGIIKHEADMLQDL